MFFGNKQAYSQSLPEKTFTQSVQLQDIIRKVISGGPEKSIKGIVTDEYHQPLPGVSILLKGATVGTATDADGNFEFLQKLYVGDVLIFSFIGFTPKDYVVGKDSASGIKIALIIDHMKRMGEVLIESHYTAKPTGITRWWQKVKSVF